MRMLFVKAQDNDEVITAWCAPGSREVCTRYGSWVDLDTGNRLDAIRWGRVQVRPPQERPVSDLVDVMWSYYDLTGLTVTVAP